MFVLWILRFFVFTLYESPKYLVGRGRDAEAVAIVHKVAAYNGRTSSIALEHLQAIDENIGRVQGEYAEKKAGGIDTSAKGVIKRKLEIFSGEHVRALFATRKMARNTSLLIILWGKFRFCPMMSRYTDFIYFIALIGLAFPLYVTNLMIQPLVWNSSFAQIQHVRDVLVSISDISQRILSDLQIQPCNSRSRLRRRLNLYHVSQCELTWSYYNLLSDDGTFSKSS